MTGPIDFEGINAAALCSARSLLPELLPGGKFRSLEYVARNPRRADQHPGSFTINYKTGIWKDFACGDGGGDLISLVAYVTNVGQAEAAHDLASKLGVRAVEAIRANPERSDRAIAADLGVSGETVRQARKQLPSDLAVDARIGLDGKARQLSTDGQLDERTGLDGKTRRLPVRDSDAGPPPRGGEIRRHIYRNSDGTAVRVKIKFDDDKYANWYRVHDGNTPAGWLAKKPDAYQPVPYITATLDPFDPELKGDQILWPEGEKDVESLGKLNLPAFTFGGAGDGLPDGIAHYLADRHLVILADNDDPGRAHAEKKAAIACTCGAALIRIIHFPDLPAKGDVTDFIVNGGTTEQLLLQIDTAPFWQASEAPAGENSRESSLIIRCMADIEAEKVEWLWSGRIAIGKQTLIGGEPGLGKSQITAALAAAVTTGGGWPCNEGTAPRGSVIILSAEDDASDTIRPRLDAAGADVRGVHLISAVRQKDGTGRRSFNLQADLGELEREIARIGNVRLVIIDPVSSYLGKTDSHKNADVRGTLEPLGDMAARMRVAVVSITHFSKGDGKSAVNSFIGSIAFVAAARAAFIVTRDPENDDPARRLFVQAKNNLAIDSGGLAFRVEQRIVGNDIVASAVMWEGERITQTADEILAAGREGKDTPERAEAEEFLRDTLAGGPRPATEVLGRSKRVLD